MKVFCLTFCFLPGTILPDGVLLEEKSKIRKLLEHISNYI